MTSSMWNLPNAQNIKTPLSMLKEQANYLTSQSGNELVGQAATFGSGNELRTDFRINVPSLNGYTYVAVIYLQPVTSIYPGRFISVVQNGKETVVSNDAEFEASLDSSIKSKEMTDLLTNLLSQAMAARQ